MPPLPVSMAALMRITSGSLRIPAYDPRASLPGLAPRRLAGACDPQKAVPRCWNRGVRTPVHSHQKNALPGSGVHHRLMDVQT